MSFDRRALLCWAAASVGASARAHTWWSPLERCSTPDADAVARWIIATPREQVLGRALREHRAGLPEPCLLAGTLLAAAREIRPNIASFNHAALVVNALRQLAPTAADDQRLALVLWGIDNFKASQAAEREDWKLGPAKSTERSPSAARAELVGALERWDPDAADAALVSCLRAAPVGVALEVVLEYAMRSRSNAGHKAIYAMVAARSLPIVGERLEEDVLRSCVSSLLPEGARASAEPFAKSREIVDRPHAWAGGGASDAGARKELQALLRSASSVEVPAAVAGLRAKGLSAADAWDACIALAAEVAVSAPGIGPLHAFTSTNALHCIARDSSSARVADLALLQAAVWTCEFRAAIGSDERADGSLRIDALEPEPIALDAPDAAGRIEQLLGKPSDDRRAAARRTLHVAGTTVGAERLTADLLAVARAKGSEAHEFKLPAAVLEELAVSGPGVRGFALAALAVNLPHPQRAATEDRSRIADTIAVSR